MRILIAVSGVLLAIPAWGQAPAGPPADTITVTAHRTAQPVQRTGSAVSIISRQQIDARQSMVAADALRAVPGLVLARSGPLGAQTQLRMRGAEANQVMVLIDGVKANDLATADEFSFEHLTTFDIDHIEVVRGPQSALWGSDALAGVINVVTRTPQAPVEAAGFFETGSHGSSHGGARLGLRSERSALMLSGSSLHTDGTNAARAGTEADGYSNATGSLNAGFALHPALTLGLSVRHTDSTTEFDSIDSTTTGLPTDADNATDATQNYLRAGGRLELLNGRWMHQLHYAVTDTDTDTTTEDLATPERDYGRASVAGGKYGLYYQTSIRVTSGSDPTPGHLLTLAVDHERQEFSQRGEVQDFFGTLYDPNQDETRYDTGYAAEYLANVGRDLSLSASLRRDDFSDFEGATTWRATASWALPATATRLHSSFGTGQKAPTFVERYGFYPNQFTGNPNLQPETSKGWDAGIEQRWAGGRVVTDITYFRAVLDNEINGLYCPPPTFACTATNQQGESRRRGVEVIAEATLSERYTVSAAYTYTDSRADDPNTAQLALAREVRRPLHTGSLNLNGRWLADRLSVNLGGAYTGQRQDDFYPPPFFFPAERVTLDSYLLVSLAASYEITKFVEIHGRVENALDEDYEDVYGFNTPGASAFIGLRVSLAR